MGEKKKNIFGIEADDEYLGNIWGWKTSLIGLAVILFLLALMVFRHYQIDDWRMMTEEGKKEIIK